MSALANVYRVYMHKQIYRAFITTKGEGVSGQNLAKKRQHGQKPGGGGGHQLKKTHTRKKTVGITNLVHGELNGVERDFPHELLPSPDK